MSNKLIAHRCFQRLTASKLEHDPIIAIITNQTEEGRKVQRNEGTVYVNVFERVAGPGQLDSSKVKNSGITCNKK